MYNLLFLLLLLLYIPDDGGTLTTEDTINNASSHRSSASLRRATIIIINVPASDHLIALRVAGDVDHAAQQTAELTQERGPHAGEPPR